MRILFISPNREEINMRTWPLGMACVAASARDAGHQVRLVDLIDQEDPLVRLEKELHEFDPQLIAVSVRNIDDQNMVHPRFLLDRVREVTSTCKRISPARIVLGGAGYSMFPVAALEYLGADMGIQGEGEAVFPDLAARLTDNAELRDLPGLYIKGEGLHTARAWAQDLDEFALPGPELLPPPEHNVHDFWVPVQTRRGCAMRCSYCSTPLIEGRRYRSRSPEVVALWLQGWVDAGFKNYYFVDNTFNLPPFYAKNLCKRIVDMDLDISWRAIIYPKSLDEELVRLMAGAGCTEVALGFESGSENILHVLNKRFHPDDIRRAAKILEDNGIRRTGFLMFGAPGETRQTVDESLEFADSLNLDMVKITMGIRIYPQTELAKIAVARGVISPDDDLLLPAFYLAKGLEGWLPETLDRVMSERPHWVY